MPNFDFGDASSAEDLDLNPRTRLTSEKVDGVTGEMVVIVVMLYGIKLVITSSIHS